MSAGLAAFLLLVQPAPGTGPVQDYGEPYRILAQANLALDPDLAASAYSQGAKLIFDYPGQLAETFDGRDAIRSSYVRTFSQVEPGKPIKLDFRFDPPGLASASQTGIYRAAGTAQGQAFAVYGKFSVRLVKEHGAWRFAEDRGGPATAADFEKLPQ